MRANTSAAYIRNNECYTDTLIQLWEIVGNIR